MHRNFEFLIPGDKPKKGLRPRLRTVVRARNEANAKRRLSKYGKVVEVIYGEVGVAV